MIRKFTLIDYKADMILIIIELVRMSQQMSMHTVHNKRVLIDIVASILKSVRKYKSCETTERQFLWDRFKEKMLNNLT